MMEHFRAEKGKSPTLADRYYISSKALTTGQAGLSLGDHWSLDVSLQEDACPIYRENAAENLAGLRHMALNMMRSEKTKLSIPMKQKRCLMNPVFLEQVLLAGFASMVN